MSLGDGEPSASERRDALKEVLVRARSCVRCGELAESRRSVVFGAGNADADLMFVGEAPGASEDEQGLPFVGRAGKLLEQLLGEIGMSRAEVFIANVLKCRPPGNRDPMPLEIENCQEYLLRQVELIQPAVICTLGNFSTKLLRGDPTGITRVHGRAEVIELGRRAVRLYPIYHPAAALYTPRMLETLREDFIRLPDLLALGPPEQHRERDAPADPARTGQGAQMADPVETSHPGPVGETGPAADPASVSEEAALASPAEDLPPRAPEADQLGLF